MDRSDGIRLVCPQCFSSNHPEDITCFLCGHALDAAMPKMETGAPKSPASPSSPESVNPYAPPAGGYSPAVTFRINSLLMVIAVIAVCMGVAHENLVLGIILAVAAVPALVYTVIVVEKLASAGNPVAALDKVVTFLIAIGGVVIIEFSALVAFCMTCFPIGYVSISGSSGAGVIVAFAVGGIAGIAAAVYAAKLLVFRKGRHRRFTGKP